MCVIKLCGRRTDRHENFLSQVFPFLVLYFLSYFFLFLKRKFLEMLRICGCNIQVGHGFIYVFHRENNNDFMFYVILIPPHTGGLL